MSGDARNSLKSFINNVIWYVVGIFDYLNTSAIYTGYVVPAMMQMFSTLQLVFFPIYAVNTCIYAILAVTNLLFDRDKKTNDLKKENIIRLVINILSALLVTTAVVGMLAFSAVMGVASTFLFAANMAMTIVYNFSATAYHLYHYVVKGRQLKNPLLSPEDRERLTEERKAHFGSMMGYLVVGVTIAAAALAGALVVLGGFVSLAAIGITAGVIGALFCAYALYRKIKDTKDEAAAAAAAAAVPPQAGFNSGDITQGLSKVPTTIRVAASDNLVEQESPVALQTDAEKRAEEERSLLAADESAANHAEESGVKLEL